MTDRSHSCSHRRLLLVGAAVLVAASCLRGQQPEPPTTPQPPAEAQKVPLPGDQPPPSGGGIAPPGLPQTAPAAAQRRVKFKVDPKTPLKDLLPRAPKDGRRKPSLPGDDLTQVPEVSLHEPLDVTGEKAFQEIGGQIVKINHINKDKQD